MTAPRSAAWLVCAALAGCDSEEPPHFPDGDGVAIGGSDAVDSVCAHYCGESLSTGCPPASDDCEAACRGLFTGTCEQKLADYLTCAPAGLVQGCLVGSPPACSPAEDALLSCFYCGDGEAEVVGKRGCRSSYACGLVTSCNDDGECTCDVSGGTATCTAAIAGIQACLAGTSCCGALLQ